MPRGRPKGAMVSNEYQVLHQRLRWLRQTQTPYMTQEQLAHASGISQSFIAAYETGKIVHMSTMTIKKLAAALGCTVSVKIMRVSDREIMESQVAGPPLPFAPKRTGKMTAKARSLAVSLGYSPWTEARLRKLEPSHKSNGAIEDLPSDPETSTAE